MISINIRSYFMAIILLVFPMLSLAGSTQYIDLSHDYSEKSLHWPGSSAFEITNIMKIFNPHYVSNRNFSSNEHVGTHVDAPNHFTQNDTGVDQIPLTSLIGPTIKIDVANAVKQNSDYQISIADIKKWEEKNGRIPDNTIVLLNTGYAKYWGELKKYAGMGQDESQLHFPGLNPATAEWLIKERKIKAVGIDTFSIDYGQTKDFSSHKLLTKNHIPIFENVASMENLPAKNFIIYALPMKIKQGTGAPVRIIAQL